MKRKNTKRKEDAEARGGLLKGGGERNMRQINQTNAQ